MVGGYASCRCGEELVGGDEQLGGAHFEAVSEGLLRDGSIDWRRDGAEFE